MGRPKRGAGCHFEAALLARIRYHRQAHSGWGAASISNELIQNEGYSVAELPSCRTIERILKVSNLTAEREKHRPLSTAERQGVDRVHQCWQMDDKGVESYAGVGLVGMINFKDVKSRAHTQAYGVPLAHCRCRPTLSDYQCALRLAFIEFGLPERIQADHGSLFYENRSQSPFPTALHLWLLGLGIQLEWARIYRPTDQAIVERTHQVLHKQIQRTQPFKDWQEFQNHVNKRRYALNYQITCQTLGQPPLKAFADAKHSSRYYCPQKEGDKFDTKRIKKYLADKEWFRKTSATKTISLGGQVYYLAKAEPKRELKIKFDAQQDTLIFYDDKELVQTMPIKGINFEDSVDEKFLKTLKGIPFELPFDWKTRQINTTF